MTAQTPAFSKRALRSLVLVAAAAATPSFALAQTSGTWLVDVGTAGGSWSNPANWVNGAVPGNGGTATFETLSTFTTAPIAVIQDQANVTLSGITFDTFITYALNRPAGNTTNVITLTGPAEVRHARPSINAWGTTFNGHFLSTPIAGTSGFNKTGPGTVSVTVPNTFTGGATITDGIVRTTAGDAAFGDAANTVTLVNGQIRTATSAFNSARTFNLTGVGTLETTASGAATLSGQVTGAGAFNKSGSARMDLTGVASNTGAFNIHSGSIVMGGNGAITSSSGILAVGTITLDNAAVNNANRLGDATPIKFTGSGLTMTGNAAAASSEQVGPVTLGSSLTFVTVTPNAAQPATVATGNVARENGGAAFVRGTSLGAPAGPNVAQVTIANPTLVGGGGAAGSTNVSIIPWAFGNTSAAAAANAATNSLVTHGATGVRPLDTNSEYLGSIVPGTVSSDNVRITNSNFFGAATTINALVVAPGGLEIGGGGTLTVSSGALLNLNAGVVVNNPVNFGSSEAMLHTPSNATFNGPISGSGGLTKTGEGNATFGNAASTYTGATTLGGGSVNFTSSVSAGGPAGVFGADASPINLAGGGFNSVRLQYAGTSSATFDRDLVNNSVNALGNQALLPRFGVSAGQTLTMNGDIQLNFPLAITGTAGAHVILNGNISGGTFLTDTSTAITITLNGNNTHAGMELLTGTFNVGSDTAFGNGIVKMAGLGTAPNIAAVGGPRTLGNEFASLRLGGNYWQIVGDQPLTLTGSINLGGSFPHVINNSALTTYAGVLHTGGFTKSGSGTLLVSGDNIYTGNTTVSAGALRVGHANALGSVDAPTVVANGAALEIGGGVLSAEPVSVSGAGVNNGGAIRSTSGNNSLGPVTVTGAANIAVDAGTLLVGNVSSATGSEGIFKTGPGVLSARRYRLFALDVTGGTAAVTPGRSTDKTSVVNQFLIGSDDRLDLGDNDLVIDYGAESPLNTVRVRIDEGHNNGAWDGTGITSSMADAEHFALGYAQSIDIFDTFPATFSGQQVDITAVLVRWTRYGDANLDGVVNLPDFNRLAANFGAGPGAVWSQGDFDYDGVVNLSDFNKLAANFGLSAAGPDVTPADWAALGAAVPEPAASSLLLVGAGVVLWRRRRRA